MEASLAVFPILILFTASQFGVMFEDRFPFLAILEYFPSAQLANLLALMQTDYQLSDTFESLGITLIWTIAITIISIVLYKKRLMD